MTPGLELHLATATVITHAAYTVFKDAVIPAFKWLRANGGITGTFRAVWRGDSKQQPAADAATQPKAP